MVANPFFQAVEASQKTVFNFICFDFFDFYLWIFDRRSQHEYSVSNVGTFDNFSDMVLGAQNKGIFFKFKT